MSKQYSIFIAGSTELKKERQAVSNAITKLNTFYNQRGINLVAQSCDFFGDNQPAYDNFIAKKADMVIVIIDGSMNPKTEDELLLALNTFRRNGSPRVRVLMRKSTELTPGIARVQGLLKPYDEKYYREYSDESDLEQQAYDRILHFVEDCVRDRWRIAFNRFRVKMRPFYIPLLLCSLLLLGSLLAYTKFVKQPPLIFAGGGSVANFIHENTLDSIDINSYPNSIYINLASGSAWSLLAEDANRYMEMGDRKKYSFVSICLSADKLDSTFVNEKTKQAFSRARIVEYFLGYDPLSVYISNRLLPILGLSESDTALTGRQLARAIHWMQKKKEKGRLFTTSKTSGTLRLYQRCFSNEDGIILEDMMDNKTSFLFYINSSSDYINTLDVEEKLPYMILGSDYYYPKMLEKEYRGFHVLNNNGTVVAKPMYLYFVAYKHDEHYCEIRKPIIKFLKSIRADKRISPSLWEQVCRGDLQAQGGEFVVELNKAPTPQ